jgi:hypothetical protein
VKKLYLYLNNLSKNIINFFRYNLKREISNTQEELLKYEYKLRLIRQELLYFKIIDYFDIPRNEHQFEEELKYLKSIKQVALFPYKRQKKLERVIVNFDKRKNLPYVNHSGKKLYYPKKYKKSEIANSYRSLIEEQNILGGNYLTKAPHQYETDKFRVKHDDIVLDVGAAEALFSLEVIDKAKKVYIFEPDKKWFEPIHATFEAYQDKVVVINKMVSNLESSKTVRLDSCLKEKSNIKGLFIKMDIEGDECKVVSDNQDFFKQKIEDIRVVCCTYHKQDDADFLYKSFQYLGYKTEFSDGYMIYVHDENIRPPYFRKGLIRAQKLLPF